MLKKTVFKKEKYLHRFWTDRNLAVGGAQIKHLALLLCVLKEKKKERWLHSLFSFFFLTQAIRSLKSEADWQEILKKVKVEEEESSVPTDLFKVKAQYV